MENKVIICGSSLGDSIANFLRAINGIKSKDGYLERVWLIKVRSGKIWTLFSNFNYLLKGGRPPPPSPLWRGKGGCKMGKGLPGSPYEAHQERRTLLGQRDGASKEPLRGSLEAPDVDVSKWRGFNGARTRLWRSAVPFQPKSIRRSRGSPSWFLWCSEIGILIPETALASSAMVEF